MTININIIHNNDYLEFFVTGTYDLIEAINRFPLVLDVCRLTGLTKVLIDFTELQGEGSGTEKCLYAFGIEDHYIKYINSGGHKLQVAYVGSSNPKYDPGAAIAKSSHLPFKLFDERFKAFEWLQVEKKQS